MKKYFRLLGLAAAMLLLPMAASAQDDDGFTADRPGATTGPDVLAKRALNWETGMEYEWDRIGGDAIRTFNCNNSMLRYGLTDYAELRVSIAGSYTYGVGGNYGGISDLSVGTKVKLFDGDGWLPKVALLGTLLIPGGENSSYLPERIGGDFHLLFSNELCSWCSLGYDVGLTWTPNDREEAFLGFALSFQPTEKLGCFVEEYNTFADETSCRTEIGLSYMLGPRLQIDAYSDFDLKHFSHYNNIGIGLAWKIL